MKYILLLVILILPSCVVLDVSHNDLLDLNIGDSEDIVTNIVNDFDFDKADFHIAGVEYHVIRMRMLTSMIKKTNTDFPDRERVPFSQTGETRMSTSAPTTTTSQQAKYSHYYLILKKGRLLDWGFQYELKRANNKEINAIVSKFDIYFKPQYIGEEQL